MFLLLLLFVASFKFAYCLNSLYACVWDPLLEFRSFGAMFMSLVSIFTLFLNAYPCVNSHTHWV